jgi:hypothetical protein
MSPSLGRGYKPMVTAAASAALGNVASLWRDSEPAFWGSRWPGRCEQFHPRMAAGQVALRPA